MHTTIYTDHANLAYGFPRVPNLALIGEGMGHETVKVRSHIHWPEVTCNKSTQLRDAVISDERQGVFTADALNWTELNCGSRTAANQLHDADARDW